MFFSVHKVENALRIIIIIRTTATIIIIVGKFSWMICSLLSNSTFYAACWTFCFDSYTMLSPSMLNVLINAAMPSSTRPELFMCNLSASNSMCFKTLSASVIVFLSPLKKTRNRRSWIKKEKHKEKILRISVKNGRIKVNRKFEKPEELVKNQWKIAKSNQRIGEKEKSMLKE